MSCFVYIVLPFVRISFYLFNLLPGFSSLFPQVLLLCFLFLLPFPFCLNVFLSQRVSAFSLCFIILDVFVDFFLSAFPVESAILVFIFFVLFEGIPVFSQANFAPA